MSGTYQVGHFWDSKKGAIVDKWEGQYGKDATEYEYICNLKDYNNLPEWLQKLVPEEYVKTLK